MQLSDIILILFCFKLNLLSQCSLHWMLSYTVNHTIRAEDRGGPARSLSPMAGRSRSDDATHEGHEGHDNHGEEDTEAVVASSSETGDEESQPEHDDGHG